MRCGGDKSVISGIWSELHTAPTFMGTLCSKTDYIYVPKPHTIYLRNNSTKSTRRQSLDPRLMLSTYPAITQLHISPGTPGRILPHSNAVNLLPVPRYPDSLPGHFMERHCRLSPTGTYHHTLNQNVLHQLVWINLKLETIIYILTIGDCELLLNFSI